MIKKIAIFIVITIALIIACDDSPNIAPTGQLNLYIQDGMADYDSIYMVIDSVWTFLELQSTELILQKVGIDTIVISDLRNGRNELLFSNELAPFNFDGFSIDFRDGTIFMDGVAHTLNLLESGTTVYSVSYPFSLDVGDTIDALIDINLYESIIPIQQTEEYGFQPSMWLTELDSSAAIIGSTSPRAYVFLIEHNTQDTISFTKSEGQFSIFGFHGIQPGFYDVLCKPIGSDTLFFDSLLNIYQPAVAGQSYDMGLLVLPQP